MFGKKLKRRVGTTMVELLGVMVVIAILAAIAIGGISAARDNANETSAQSDLRTYTTAVQQVAMLHPEIMKFTAQKPANAVDVLVGYINEQVEEKWKFETLAGATDSGGVATSSIKRDSWGNPYGLYVYFDDKAPTYTDKDGVKLKNSDSCIYIAIVSAGKNATGGPVGSNGDNFDSETRKISSAAAMVNNTDGVDDIGVIIRVLNGDTYAATFGLDKTTLGKLNVPWIYGVPSATGGICYDFKNGVSKTASAGGSLDQYYDAQALQGAASATVYGAWS